MDTPRRGQPSDLAELLRLIEDFYATDHHPFNRTQIVRGLAPLLSGDDLGQVWVVADATSSRLAGYAIVTWSWSLESGGRDAILDEIYVADRGHGTGSALLRHALAEAARAGASAVFLETEAHNDRVRGFYRRHGFDEEHSTWMRTELNTATARSAPTHRTLHRPSWRLDEVARAGRENLDPAHARRYDTKEDADAEREVALLRELGLSRTSHVIDVGAGTGQFTLAVAPHCFEVTAIDVSRVMLDVLRAKLAAAGRSNVRTLEAGFLTYSPDGAPVDCVYSRYALHHLPDFWKALALQRVHTWLAPGGVLRLWDVVYRFGPADAEDRIERWCRGYAGGGWDSTELEEHVRDEHSTYTWLLEPMIERCGFSIETAEYSHDGFFAKYIARKR